MDNENTLINIINNTISNSNGNVKIASIIENIALYMMKNNGYQQFKDLITSMKIDVDLRIITFKYIDKYMYLDADTGDVKDITDLETLLLKLEDIDNELEKHVVKSINNAFIRTACER